MLVLRSSTVFPPSRSPLQCSQLLPLCLFRVSRAPVIQVCFSPTDLPHQDVKACWGQELDLFDGCQSPQPRTVSVFEQGLSLSRVKGRTTSLRCASLHLGPELPTTDSCEAVTDLNGAESRWRRKPFQLSLAFKVSSSSPFSGLRAHRPPVINRTLPPCFSSAIDRAHNSFNCSFQKHTYKTG